MPISDINPNHELLVDSLSSNNAITIGGFIDECYSLLATNHRFALEVFRSPMNHYEVALRDLDSSYFRRILIEYPITAITAKHFVSDFLAGISNLSKGTINDVF